MALPTALFVRAVGERRVLTLLVPLAVLAVLGACADGPVTRGGRASSGAIVAVVAASVTTAMALIFGAGQGFVLWTATARLAVVLAAGTLAAMLGRLAAHGWLTGGRAACATAVVAMVAPALNLGAFAAWVTNAPVALTALAGLVAVAVVIAGGRRVAVAAFVLYVGWGVYAIGVNLARPTYSVRDASAALDTLTRPGDVVAGTYAHLLAIETDALPLWYTPRRAYNERLNADLVRFDVRWVLIGEGRTTTQVADYPFRLTRVREIPLFPAPRGGHKATVTLYRRAD